MSDTNSVAPIAVGGIGGSGTRVIAALLLACGVYMGSDLNEALDNLWFTFLFKRRRVLLEGHAEFDELLSLLVRKMSSGVGPSPAELGRLSALANFSRIDHGPNWLRARLDSLCRPSRTCDGVWGWKEPNTHVVAERILANHKDIRYVHVSRHPLDMIQSNNQRQLAFWGPVFLERDIAIGPRDSFSYWCVAEFRARSLSGKFPGRVHFVNYDRFCSAPAEESRVLLNALGIEAQPSEAFTQRIENPRDAASREHVDLSIFNPTDLEVAARLGYIL